MLSEQKCKKNEQGRGREALKPQSYRQLTKRQSKKDSKSREDEDGGGIKKIRRREEIVSK